MRRTKEWWAQLSKWERSELIYLERANTRPSKRNKYYPDDCGACPGCGNPTTISGLCMNCCEDMNSYIQKADKATQDLSSLSEAAAEFMRICDDQNESRKIQHMRRTKEWWQALSSAERTLLTALELAQKRGERFSRKYRLSADNVVCSFCLGPTSRVGLCEVCQDIRKEIIAIADNTITKRHQDESRKLQNK